MDPNATLQQAIAAHQQNRLGDAERLYRAVLSAQPLNAVALHNLGLIAAATGHYTPAIDLIGRAVRLEPGNTNYRLNHVGALDAAGRWAEAQEGARELVAARPGDLTLRANLARMLLKHGKAAEAAEEWQIVAKQSTFDPMQRFEYAQALELSGQLERAEAEYRRALKQRQNYAQAMVNLAGICLKTDRFEEGIDLLECAATAAPANVAALSTLGGALISRGHISDGFRRLQEAYRLAPRDLEVLRNLGYAHLVRGEVEQALRINKQVGELAPANPHFHATMLLTSLYVEASPEEELELHKGYGARAAREVKAKPQAAHERQPGEKVRIGYVSPDLRTHPVGHFIEPVLAHHDRSRFEVHCFSTSPTSDDLTARIRSCVDAIHPAHQLTFEQLDALIREKQIDILVDLAGHTGGSAIFVFAARPALLQVSYLGYPHTTGLSTIDLRITDAIADPPGDADRFHVESLARMPHSFGLFQPPPGAPDVLPSPHRASGHITFGTVSRLEKWSDRTLADWSAVLNKVDDSRLRVIGLGYDDVQFRQEVLGRLERFGIVSTRVEFVSRKPFLEYLSEISKIDILLDTFPFNGHTTTLQGLFMGVPTVTLSGRAHRSRMGASVMTALGLSELIAEASDGFRRVASELARDSHRLASLRATLRSRLLASSLCDGPGFVRAYETLLLDAWQTKLASE